MPDKERIGDIFDFVFTNKPVTSTPKQKTYEVALSTSNGLFIANFSIIMNGNNFSLILDESEVYFEGL